MDDMREIESRMQEVEQAEGQAAAPLPVEQTASHDGVEEVSLAAPAVLEAAQASMDRARGLVNDKKAVDKRAKDLASIANERIANQLDTERLKNEKAASKNKVERAKIANELYEAQQVGVRLRKEAKHQSEMQKARQEAEKKKAYWEAHKAVLEQYGMKEGSSRVSCSILLWLDGVKCFFNGIGKVSTALVKALRWVLIALAITGVLMAIPVTRNWILTLLGFIK